jgi:hypothetical protein
MWEEALPIARPGREMTVSGETKGYVETTMAASLDAPRLGSRTTKSRKRGRAKHNGLRWAVILMLLLNVLVWGGMIALTRGMIALDGQPSLHLFP